MCTRKREYKFKKCSYGECVYNGAYVGQRCHKHRLSQEELTTLKGSRLKEYYDNCVCLQCGEKFLLLKCAKKLAPSKGKYCSKECKIIHRSRNVTFVQCQWCKKNFRTYICKIQDGRGKYCSKKCLSLSRTIQYIGSNNPHWRGVKIHLNRIRGSKEGRAWKKLIRSRGNCELCGASTDLQAHHKIPLFTLFMTMTEGNLNHIYDPNDLFFHKEENGMLVCSSCHEIIHPYISVLKQRKK